MNVRGKKIFVGLSGGVDSAVTAALLTRAGAQVVGVFIQGWYPPGIPCTWRADRRDAMRVAARLRIPFVTLDASEEYKRGVIDYLLNEYRRGRTPNPDVMCNREVKFGAFYRFVKAHGADALATGHYARIRQDGLYRGVDDAKDQSYFLWAVPKDVLRETIFPLGEQTKEQTRAQAKQFNLPVAQKRDSQGICFLGSISVEDFLRSEFGTHPGPVIDTEGKERGSHDGVLLHTIGERLSLPDGPWYVTTKDIEQNTLVVARRALRRIGQDCIPLRETNWLGKVGQDTLLTAQYRYHGPRIPGTLSPDQDAFLLKEPLPEPLAEGQSLVVYTEDQCLGGGIMQ